MRTPCNSRPKEYGHDSPTNERRHLAASGRRRGCHRAAVRDAAVTAQTSPSGVLERIRDTGRIRLGYRADARPFSYRDEGRRRGYSIALCKQIAERVTRDLQAPALTIEWVPCRRRNGSARRNRGPSTCCAGPTRSRSTGDARSRSRRRSSPAASAPCCERTRRPQLRDVLSGNGQTFQPTWRASATPGPAGASVLGRHRHDSRDMADQAHQRAAGRDDNRPVGTYDDGVEALRSRQVERAVR